MKHVKSIFVRTPGEPWPPRWILFLGVIAVLGSSLWNVSLLNKAETRAAASQSIAKSEGEDRQELARQFTEACRDSGEFRVNNRNVCEDAEAQATEPVATPPASNTPLLAQDGRDGRNGFNGVNGKDGTPGAEGKPGKDGNDGVAGLSVRGEPGESMPGRDGVDGQPGTDGQPGAPGAPGPAGPAPTKLTFSNGTTCTPAAPGSTEYTCDGPPPGGESPSTENRPLLTP